MGVSYDKTLKRYTIRIARKGFAPIRERLPAGTSRREAEERDAILQRQIFEISKLGRKPDRSIAEAVERWINEECLPKPKNQRSTLNHLSRIVSFCAEKHLLDLPEAVNDYTRSNRGDLSPATLARRISIMKRIATLAWKQWGWLDQPIHHRIQMPAVNNARQVFLTREEILRIVECCARKETKALIRVSAWTGLRLGEILKVSFTPHSIPHSKIVMANVRDSKNGKPRVVPLVGWAKWAIKSFPLTYHKRTLIRDFEQAREKAGMPHVHFHDLRHSCASMLLAAGVSLEVIGQILGHKSVQTTRRYAHLSTEAMAVALRKIA